MRKELETLHSELTKKYVQMLQDGCEDHRILKEVREFLQDNNITVNNIEDSIDDSEVIEINLDNYEMVNNG